MNGLHISIGRRPVVTLVGQPSDAAELVSHLDAGSRKRYLVRRALLLAARWRLIRLVGHELTATRADQDPGSDFGSEPPAA